MRRLRGLALAIGLAAAGAAAAVAAPAASEERLREALGQPVYSADGVRFGKVRALVVESRRDRVIGAVVEYGGFLGAFTRTVLVPAEEMATVNADSLVLLWTADEVETAPTVDADQVAQGAELVDE